MNVKRRGRKRRVGTLGTIITLIIFTYICVKAKNLIDNSPNILLNKPVYKRVFVYSKTGKLIKTYIGENILVLNNRHDKTTIIFKGNKITFHNSEVVIEEEGE